MAKNTTRPRVRLTQQRRLTKSPTSASSDWSLEKTPATLESGGLLWGRVIPKRSDQMVAAVEELELERLFQALLGLAGSTLASRN